MSGELSLTLLSGPATVREAVEGFLRQCRARNLSPRTLELNADVLRRFCEHCGNVAPERLTPDSVLSFLASCGQRTSTARRYHEVLRAFGKYLQTIGLPDPAAGIERPKAPLPVIEPLTQEEVEAMLAACPDTPAGLRDRLLLLLLVDCGLRASEVAEACDGRHLDPEELEPREVVDAPGRSASEPGGSRPGDVYNEWGDVLSLLGSHGWTVHERRGPGGTVYLTRPGKEPRDGISATFGRDGRRILYVFSSNAPPFEAGKGYTPFTVYALLEHGGDFASAARALASQGYVEPVPEDSAAWQGGDRPQEYAATDKGDRLTAHRDTLKELLSGSVRWCPQWKSWLRWNGVRWERCPEEELRSTAYEALRLRYLLALTAEQRDTRSWAAARLHELESGRYYKEALELLKGETGFLTHATEFDRDPNLLNTPSGVVDLRTGELRPARPEDLMTKATGVPYDPEAGCPQFLEFLQEILPQEGMPEFLQLVFGSGLLGENRFHRGFIFYGSGANGKSTLLKVIQTVAGDYCDCLPRDVLLSRRQQQDAARVALAACEGLRLGLLEELADGAVLSAVALKDLVSNNRMQVRGLYEGYRSAVIGLTPVVATNRKPAIPENTEGVWRRLALVPFTVTIPEERRDPEKAEKLLREAAGILRWMVQGAGLALQRGELEAPEAVRSATEEYRTEEDVLAAFLDDCCVLGPRYQVPCGELYAAYQAWCNENTGGRLLSQKAFGQALRDRGVTDTRSRREGRLVRLYVGIGLRTDDLPAEGAAVTDVTDTTPILKTSPARTCAGKVSENGLNPSHPSHPAGSDATFRDELPPAAASAPEETPPAAVCPRGEEATQATAPDADLIDWAREMLEHPERLRPVGLVKEPARFLEANLYDLLHGSGPAAGQARARLQDTGLRSQPGDSQEKKVPARPLPGARG